MSSPAIDNLIQSSSGLQWISYSDIADIRPTQTDNIYYASCCGIQIVLLRLGSTKECTQTFVSEFARKYSLPTHKYNNDDNQFRRYKIWLRWRNDYIKGFTKHDDNYYMVAKKMVYHCYCRYGFCSECGILRCSPLWCVCGHKQLSDGWTSNNERLDEFIKKTQLQTNSANDAYLEWIPFEHIQIRETFVRLNYLSTIKHARVALIPLEISDETDDLYFDKLCDEHPDILTKDVWITIGFTYRASPKGYYLIKQFDDIGLCLACVKQLVPKINTFCYHCKAPRPLDWTTGNKVLDLFIMESWRNTAHEDDAYIQWIEYSLLTNVQWVTSLRHGCSRIASWLEPTLNELTKVTLKPVGDIQSLDSHQLIKEYPEMLTPDNIWIIGITQDPYTREYYLVFYYEIQTILDKYIRLNMNRDVRFVQYANFYDLKEIGSGCYGTIYVAKHEVYVRYMPGIVVLKCFKNFDQAPELVISEFRNHARCKSRSFLQIHGVTQNPETKDYIIIMQYANLGNLLSYLDQNINRLTWKTKLDLLKKIACYLHNIHEAGLVHCNLHGGNIVLHNSIFEVIPFICDLGLSRSVNSRQTNPTIQGVLPFVAPEVFRTRKFTQKSDIYSFGIIMYLIATGEPPFKDREFSRDLIRDIMCGLRPLMPDSAPEEYKKIARWCCDADPNKRLDAKKLRDDVRELILKVQAYDLGDSEWNTIYHSNVI